MAIIGHGTTFGYSTTLNGTYTDFSEVLEITPNTIEVADVNKTHIASADKFEEFLAGLANAGEFEVKLIFTKAVEAALDSLLRAERFWRMRFPLDADETTPSMWRCKGYLKSMGDMVPKDSLVEIKIKIKLTGKPQFDQGS